MVDELLKYVSDQMDRGYTPGQIKDVLLRSGYSPAIVEGVIDSAVARRSKSSNVIRDYARAQPAALQANPLTPKLVLGIIAVLLIIGAAISIPLFFKPRQALLDLLTTQDREYYAPGEDVGFDLEVFNMGSKERFDVSLNYRIIDSNDNLLTSKEETIAISTSTSYHKSAKLPAGAKEGDYTLKVFANYDDKVATSSFSFKVDESLKPSTGTSSCNDGLKNQDETGIDCGGACGGYWYNSRCNAAPEGASGQGGTSQPAQKPSCDDGVKNQNEAGPDCGGVCGGYWYNGRCNDKPRQEGQATQAVPGKSTGAMLLELRLLAKTDPEGAKEGCLEFEDEKIRDACLKSVAQTSNDPGYCELVIDDNERDLCYYPFFMAGDYSVCEKLVLPESLQTCAQLKQLAATTGQ